MFHMRIVLPHLFADFGQTVLDHRQACRLAELLARCALQSEERFPGLAEHGLRVFFAQRHHQPGGGVLRLGAAQAEFQQEFFQLGTPGLSLKRVGRVRQTRQFGPALAGRLDAVFQHTRHVGQFELHPLVQHGFEPLVGLAAAALRDQPAVVRTKPGVAQDHRVKQAQHFGAVVIQVFDQIHVGLQAQLGQQLQRCGAHQLRKPGVEGADLDSPPAAQHLLVQALQRRHQGLRLVRRHAALHQGLKARMVRGARRGEIA